MIVLRQEVVGLHDFRVVYDSFVFNRYHGKNLSTVILLFNVLHATRNCPPNQCAVFNSYYKSGAIPKLCKQFQLPPPLSISLYSSPSLEAVETWVGVLDPATSSVRSRARGYCGNGLVIKRTE
jgi:hypothetical protein